MNTPQDSSLGQDVTYPSTYDAGLLFPIPRAVGRQSIGIDGQPLPFIGHDRWQAYELGWLDACGKPCVGTATLGVPCTSPHLVESKSLKLYLNSLNAARFDSESELHARIAQDLSACAGAAVSVQAGLPPMRAEEEGELIDALAVDIDDYGPPNPGYVSADPARPAEQTLVSHLLKSNCPVTGQPDWASLVLAYRGPSIDPAGLLRYLVSFREHAEFHEQCVERILLDVLNRCRPVALSVEARYTRRGGLDINPWRATPGYKAPGARRELRQ